MTTMLRDPTFRGKDVAYTVVTRGKVLGKAVRTQRHRYTLWPSGEELYDLTADPQEQTNLAHSSEHARILAEMQTKLKNAEAKAVTKRRVGLNE